MRIILSPAKKMIEDTDSLAWRDLPVFLSRTQEILDALRGMDGGALVDTYKASLTGRTPQPEVRAAMPVRRSKDKKRAKHKEAKKKGRNGKWPEITIIAGVILFLLLIVWIMI